MQRIASLLTRVPAALLQQLHQKVANTNQPALRATLTTVATLEQLRRLRLRCFAPCCLQVPAIQLPAAQVHSSSSNSQPPHEGKQQIGEPGENDSKASSTYHVNPVSLDQLLENSPIAANAGSSSSSNPACQSQQQQQQQEQQRLTEQILSELFDAELEQRLLSAAAAARSSTNDAAAIPHLQGAATRQPAASQPTAARPSYQNQASQPLLQHQRMHQPGVLPMQQQQQQQSGAGPADSSSSSGPARVSRWTPLDISDPWAPLPGPAFARRRLPGQLQQLLQQAGVRPEAAAAAVAQAAAEIPTSTAAAAAAGQAEVSGSDSSSRVAQQQPRRACSYGMQQAQLQQQQHGATGAHYMRILNRLQHKQLVSLLDDCQAPTFGDKQLLLRRLVLLLQEQAAGAAGHAALAPPHVLGFGAGFWAEGEPGFGSTACDKTAAVDANDDSSSSSSSSSAVELETGKAVVQQQQQQWRGSGLSHQVQAAAAARQQLLDAVLDSGQVGSWLMAARAQDVCIINVSGRAGLHQQLVVATGLSQRHAHACAEAVAWQLREKATERLAQQQQQQQEFPARQLPSLSVLGDASSDWAVLDAGAVVVHVLTERARRFYNLEGLWGGPQGRFINWLKPEQVVETKDTIGRDAAHGGRRA